MKEIEVKLDDRTVVVKKLPLGRYAELLKALKKLPENLGGLDKMKEDEIFRKLPTLIAGALPDCIDMLAIATPLTVDELNTLGLDEAVELFLAVIKVNNYQDIYGKVKKALAQPAQTQ